MEEEDIHRIIALNLTTPILLIKALLSILRKQSEAQAVSVGSTCDSLGFPGYTAYCASKYGLRGFTEALRRELSGLPIKISSISPRATDTKMNSPEARTMNRAMKSQMDSAEKVARAIAEILDKPRSEKYLGSPEKYLARINRLFPSLIDKVLQQKYPP